MPTRTLYDAAGVFASGGHGAVYNITYDTIRVEGTSNTILIDQYYCPRSQHPGTRLPRSSGVALLLMLAVAGDCKNYSAAVAVSNVTFRNLVGTFSDIFAGQLLCADSTPCENIVLENVQLAPTDAAAHGHDPERGYWACWKVHGQSSAVTPPLSGCLAEGA